MSTHRHTPSPVQLFTTNELTAIIEIRQQVATLRQALEAMIEADNEYEQAYLTLHDLKSIQAEYHVDQLKRTCAKAQNVAIKARMAVFRALEKYIGSLEPHDAMDALYQMDSETHYRIMCLMSDPSLLSAC
jgi:hypothetical protein